MTVKLPRVIIFTGGYGSGKTEIAVNYALKLAKEMNNVALIDLDIVNPYFRSREAAEILEAAGVKVVAPKGKLRTADLPALPGEIYQVLHDPNTQVVIDVGGDDVGATVLGRFYSHIPKNYAMWLVMNPARPFQSEPEQVVSLARKIEQRSRQNITGIINNSNLLYETNSKYIEDNYPIIQETARLMALPIVFSAVDIALINREGMPDITSEVLAMNLHMSPEWRN